MLTQKTRGPASMARAWGAGGKVREGSPSPSRWSQNQKPLRPVPRARGPQPRATQPVSSCRERQGTDVTTRRPGRAQNQRR